MIRTSDNHVARTHNYNLYIIEQPSSWSTSQIRPSWPRSRLRLSLLLALLPKCIRCLSWPPSILLFVPTDRVSHLAPSLPPGRLLANVQVNKITAPHDTHRHINIHHIGITILLLFYTSSTLLGRPAGPDPSRLTHCPPTHTVHLITQYSRYCLPSYKVQ
jgi:hypothetical protein